MRRGQPIPDPTPTVPSPEAAGDHRSFRLGPFGWRWLVAFGLVAAALVHPLALLMARLDWRADMLTHFQGPALAATLAAVLVLWRWHPRIAKALVILAIAQVEPLVRYDGPNPVPPAPGSRERLRIVMANVLVSNEDADVLVRWIREERPDVIGLVEVSPEWADRLAELRREYPFGVTAPFGASGVALWFRERPTSVDPPAMPSPDGWPYLHATIDFAGRPRHLWLVHPSSPIRAHRRRRGFEELDGLAARVAGEGGSSVVVGDLNTTSGSPFFADFLRTTGLRDSRSGFGLQPSWPTWSPYRIAIDHAFLSEDLAVVDRRLGPDIGSDHRPLILDVAPAAEAANSATQGSQSSP